MSTPLDSLYTQLSLAAVPAEGRVGVAVALLGTDESVSLAGDERFPMQSVFKLPLAMTVFNAVDRQALRLDQPVRITPDDIEHGLWLGFEREL